MQRQSFLQGALILMVAGLVNRILGFILRVLLVKYVGDEGLGLFQMVYPFFMTLLLISTAGFPVAISKLIPERLSENDSQGAFHLLKVSLLFVSFMGTMTALTVLITANLVSLHIFHDQRIYLILIAISPALIICPLSAVFRGYFQGLHTMLPTALSQITEQVSRMLATLVIINMVAQLSLSYKSAGIALGISVGELTGLLVLLILFLTHLNPTKKQLSKNFNFKQKLKNRHTFLKTIKNISKLAIPITVGRIIHSVMMSVEAILIPRQLQLGGASLAEATSLFGQLSGMVEQVIFLPTVITIALTTSLIPDVSEAHARKNMKKITNNYQDILRVTTYLGFPMTVLFMTRGTEICQLLFDFPEAGSLLAGLAVSATFIYFLQVSSGMLNGLGKPELAVRNLSIGAVIKLTLIYYLVKSPLFGINGATLGLTIGYLVSALLNFLSIGHNIGYQINLNQTIFKPLFSSAVIWLFNSYLARNNYLLPFSSSLRLQYTFILLLLIITYLLVMVAVKAITYRDIKRFKR